YFNITHFPVINYICINSGIFNVARHLILPNPFISFDEMVQGLTTMIMSYINTEMARSEDQS
ncbi:TetR/AcrR family transcriptional regulator, partial [Acinetobacter baumannii]